MYRAGAARAARGERPAREEDSSGAGKQARAARGNDQSGCGEGFMQYRARCKIRLGKSMQMSKVRAALPEKE